MSLRYHQTLLRVPARHLQHTAEYVQILALVKTRLNLASNNKKILSLINAHFLFTLEHYYCPNGLFH